MKTRKKYFVNENLSKDNKNSSMMNEKLDNNKILWCFHLTSIELTVTLITSHSANKNSSLKAQNRSNFIFFFFFLYQHIRGFFFYLHKNNFIASLSSFFLFSCIDGHKLVILFTDPQFFLSIGKKPKVRLHTIPLCV